MPQQEDSFSLYDVGARLYTFALPLGKEPYFSLVRELTDTYPNQKFEPERFNFSASKEQFCEVGQDYVYIMEPARDDGEAAVERLARVSRLVTGLLGVTTFDTLDINVSGLLDAAKLAGRSDVIYFSGHEFLQSFLFHQVDVTSLGADGELEGLGFQFTLRKGEDTYAVRITPFENEKRFLFVDLQLAYREAEYEAAEIRQRALEGLKFLKREVVPFLKRIAHTRSAGKE